MNPEQYVDELLTIIAKANAAILDVYHSPFAVEMKADHSPLTQADKQSHTIITNELARLTPDIPVISEEGSQEQNEQAVLADTFWLVDPLDGTREFVARTGQFCVAIALIDKGLPVFGMFSIPTEDIVYYGGKSRGAYKQNGNGIAEAIYAAHSRTGIVLASRIDQGGATADYIAQHFAGDEVRAYGSMLKHGMIAEGKADAYPCIDRPLKLWDLAAGQAVIEGAGGVVTRPDGSQIHYNNPTLLVGDFVARSSV